MKKDEELEESLLSNEQQQENEKKEIIAKEKIRKKNAKIDGTNIFQRIFFTWIHPLLAYGSKHTVDVTMMPSLPDKYSTERQFNGFIQIWESMEKSENEGWTLIKALVKMHLKEWIVLLLTVIITVVFYAATPTLTALSIKFIS